MTDDIFSDLDSIRLVPDLTAGVGVREVLVTVPVRKPTRTEFIRVNGDPELILDTWLYQDKAERSEFYLVTPPALPALQGEARPFRLHVAVARPNVAIIWPLALPGEDGKTNPWHDSALEGTEFAKSSWVRLAADQRLGAYRIYKAEGTLADPEWPDKTFPELLRIAFGQRLIDSENHPVIQRLRGLV